jgi:predicted outer membrane protein
MDRRQFTAGLLLAAAPMALTRTAVAQTAAAPGAIPAPQYLAMANAGGMFLEQTARTAFDKTQDPRIKRFSRAEVVEQVSLGDRLTTTSQAEGITPVAAMPGAAPGGFVGGLVAAPFAITGAAVGAAGNVVGGALGAGPVPMTTPDQKAQMAAQLQSLPPGPQYDASFVQAQLMGHQEAYALHSSYAQNGDDPALRRIARGALPLLRLHISQLTRMQGSMGTAQG